MDASKSLSPYAGGEIAAERARAAGLLARRGRFSPAEALPWLAAVAAFFIFPNQMVLGSQTLIMIVFALSLDLILGYAGIVTLGHAAFFGLGAYGASLLIIDLGWSEPISGVLCGALVAAVAGFLSGWLLLHYRGLAFLVLTLSTTIMLQQCGNLFRDFTGGYDGIPGVNIAPLFGRFNYDIYGHTYYLYCLGVLLIVFYCVRRIVHSPFGQALVGIRENVSRMNAIGSPVHWRLVVAYTISAAVAGIAGALFAQTNAFVTLGVFDFDQSAAVLVMLILGGAGRLYGAFIGAALYMVLQNELAKASPEFWQFGVGLLLIGVVLLVRRGTLLRVLNVDRLLRWRTQP
ncbi:MAG: branched-chain amino acid ABC transporter permease [Hyphomicrobiales bacterium]|nr:branched-chain amino acid ABC transporter permease [Hyphomicrobiales bacterium]